MFVADATNDAIGGKLAQAVNGEDAVDVLIGMAMVIMLVCDHQLVGTHIAGDKPPGVIAFEVIWLLVAQVDARRAHQREGGLT
jgi:uncharacterized membrane protein